MLHIIVDKKEVNYSYLINSEEVIAVELSHNKKNNKIIINITIKEKENNRVYINSENYKDEDIKELMYYFNGLNIKKDYLNNDLILNTVIFKDYEIEKISNLVEEEEEE